ncbi:MAG: FAD-dependent oxidoreductase [Alphaproteobacteria bacterium]|nr:FAD-dependent oxidoreductase [Alphaproteobacteria bacterium]
MKIGIVGAGISGLGAAYLLAPHHHVTLFEKNGYIGGHSRTIKFSSQAGEVPVDTGFIVFNDRNYPNLSGLFQALDVPYHKSRMSFGVSVGSGWLEYASGGLFAQTRNVVRPAYWAMLADIVRFNKQALAYLERDSSVTLGQCLDELNMGEWFRRYYILAMGAAIWSSPVDGMLNFPAKTFVRFFKNHGLLNLVNRPQWFTVTGGSREYVARIVAATNMTVHSNAPVTSVKRNADGTVTIRATGLEEEAFDQVVLACHADEALAMIADADENERNILGSFRYQENRIVVHSDGTFMPERRKCWASWVYLSEEKKDSAPAVSLTYWMNNLRNARTPEPVFVTLNPGRRPDERRIVDEHVFSHPVFDRSAIDAQSRIVEIQGRKGLWFCGAYQRYGFHEDGLLSAVNVAAAMGIQAPWQ